MRNIPNWIGLEVPYLSPIGVLIFLATTTRPDITFSLNLLASPDIIDHADVGYLSDPHKARSQTGYVFIFGDNPNKFLKPSSSFTNNTAATATATTASAAVATPASFSSFGMTSNVGGIPNECFFCKKNFKKENHTYIYRSLAFCTEECREVQISFDQNMKKTRMEAANKKGYN
ncbi:hypothetical protein FXO37_04443 [Capsicum annuum]|nr:hypothetical protein FXO37_04443 [Capsicum annuum]